MKRFIFFLVFCCLSVHLSNGQNRALVRTYKKAIKVTCSLIQIPFLHTTTSILIFGLMASQTNILPFEGATTGRRIYRQALLNLALEKIRHKRYAEALPFIERSRLWPEQLGAGKPYPEYVDERLEDWLSYSCLKALKRPGTAIKYLNKVVSFQPGTENGVRNFFQGNSLLSAWALWLTKDKSTALNWLNAQ
ncbi:MAG: hypothetical protein JWQ28_2847 [Pedobacter sp.]|jgi:hypothetical protein|nr:hypothetical protein [Pedobacter sp.]